MTEKLLAQKYRHKQKRMSKTSYSESETDFSNLLSTLSSIFSEHESDSDFNSVFINLDICVSFALYFHSSK